MAEQFKNPLDQANVLLKDVTSPTGYKQTRMNALKRYKNTIEPIDNLLRETGWIEDKPVNPIKKIKRDYGDNEPRSSSGIQKSNSFLTNKGRSMLEQAQKHGLSRYYDEKAGSFLIPGIEYGGKIKANVNQFLDANSNYGINEDEDGNVIIYELDAY